jgi:hypothetical protein
MEDSSVSFLKSAGGTVEESEIVNIIGIEVIAQNNRSGSP